MMPLSLNNRFVYVFHDFAVDDLSLHSNRLEGYIGKSICRLPSLDHVTADCIGGKK